MATSRSTMGADVRPIHPDLIKATLAASAAQAEVCAAAEYLADAMRRIHGGSWRIQIDHEVRFVMIVDRNNDEPVTPKPEIA